MNNDKRIFALVSLGLFLTACLGPFALAASGHETLAIRFAAVAGLLALVFGALGWNDRIGRTVTVSILALLAVGGGGSVIIYIIRSHPSAASLQQPATELANPR